MKALSMASLALATALSLSACSGSTEPPAERPATELEAPVTITPPPIEIPAMEGPATEPGFYPGGVQAEIVSVDVGPSEPAYASAGEPTWVRVVTRISTVGQEAYPVGDWGPQGSLRHGPNRTEAIAYASGANADVELVAVGSSIDYVEEFALTVPEADVGELRYSFSPAAEYEEPWVFLDVQDTSGD